MKQTGKCPKCSSADVIADAKAIDRGEGNAESELSVATFRNPSAFIFKGKQRSTLSAWVCGSCGFVEFYADHPEALQLPTTANS